MGKGSSRLSVSFFWHFFQQFLSHKTIVQSRERTIELGLPMATGRECRVVRVAAVSSRSIDFEQSSSMNLQPWAEGFHCNKSINYPMSSMNIYS